MILKLIIFGTIIYALYRFFGGKLGFSKNRDNSKRSLGADTLIECNRCSTYVTKKEAIEYKGKFYCSEECKLN